MAEPGTARIPPILCVGMGLQLAAGGAFVPFLGLYFRDRGLSYAEISLMLSAGAASLMVVPFFWGMIADRYVPLNRLFVVMNLLAAGSLTALGAQTHPGAMLAAFVAFYACFSPLLTLINALGFHHLADPNEQFGRLRSWGSIGWTIPFVPIAIWLAVRPGARLEFLLWFSAALFVAMACVSKYLPHTASRGSGLGGVAYWGGVRRLMQDGDFRVVLAAMFLVSGSFSILMFFSPPYLEAQGVARPWIGPVQAIGVLCEVIFFRWQPWLIRRWRYAATIQAGCLALVFRHLIFGVSTNAWVLSLSYVLAGAVIVFLHMGISVWVNAAAGAEVRSTAQTLLALVGQGMGPMCCNWAAGRLAAWRGDDLRVVFLFAAGLAGVAALLIATRTRGLNAPRGPHR